MYVSRCGTEWEISFSAIRKVISEQAMSVFRIEGHTTEDYPTVDVTVKDTNFHQVSSTEIINREVGLATCWRFCTSMGGTMRMDEGQGVVFEVYIPVQTPSDNK